MTTPVLIVGAGRSGTNLLAETFERESPRFRNLFENRYIWTYGQRDRSTDIRHPAEATERIARYIKSHFARQAVGRETILVDKTPGNALRLPFVEAIYPDVRVLNIVRDGRDNILSRTRQWEHLRPSEGVNRKTGWRAADRARILLDRMRHARHLAARGNLPADRMPAMMADAVPALLAHLLTGRPRRYAERVPGLAEILRTQGLDGAAAVQWREVVMAATTDGRRLGPTRYLEVRYEDLLAAPASTWRRILDFLGVEETGGGARYLSEVLRPSEHGSWRRGHELQRVLALEAHLRPTLEYLGYAWEDGALADRPPQPVKATA